MTDETQNAMDALAGVRDSEMRLAEKTAHCPPERHAAFGTLFFLLIFPIAVSHTAQFMALPFVVLGIVLVKRWDERRFGVFINGYRRGKTLPVTILFVGVIAALVAAAIHMRHGDFSIWSKLGLGAISFALAICFSLAWQKIYRSELTERNA